jgi:hypothetical protein
MSNKVESLPEITRSLRLAVLTLSKDPLYKLPRRLFVSSVAALFLFLCTLVITPAGNAQSRTPGNAVAPAVQKHFGTTAEAVTSFQPFYVIGDFNGDGVPDLAVVVRLKARRLTLPADVKLLNPFERGGAIKFPNNPVDENKLAIAIVHSWNQPVAAGKLVLLGDSPILILQNARAISSERGDRLNLIGLRSRRAKRGRGEILPGGSKGDVILLTTEVGGDGLLYWNGRTYLWEEPAED